VPDDLAVLDDLPHAVKGNPSGLARFVHDFKRVPLVFGERDLLERDPVDDLLVAVEVTEFKAPLAELLVPPDAAEQSVNGDHSLVGIGGGGAGGKAAVGTPV
jgi:hypothetical protein